MVEAIGAAAFAAATAATAAFAFLAASSAAARSADIMLGGAELETAGTVWTKSRPCDLGDVRPLGEELAVGIALMAGTVLRLPLFAGAVDEDPRFGAGELEANERSDGKSCPGGVCFRSATDCMGGASRRNSIGWLEGRDIRTCSVCALGRAPPSAFFRRTANLAADEPGTGESL